MIPQLALASRMARRVLGLHRQLHVQFLKFKVTKLSIRRGIAPCTRRASIRYGRRSLSLVSSMANLWRCSWSKLPQNFRKRGLCVGHSFSLFKCWRRNYRLHDRWTAHGQVQAFFWKQLSISVWRITVFYHWPKQHESHPCYGCWGRQSNCICDA